MHPSDHAMNHLAGQLKNFNDLLNPPQYTKEGFDWASGNNYKSYDDSGQNERVEEPSITAQDAHNTDFDRDHHDDMNHNDQDHCQMDDSTHDHSQVDDSTQNHCQVDDSTTDHCRVDDSPHDTSNHDSSDHDSSYSDHGGYDSTSGGYDSSCGDNGGDHDNNR